MMASAHLFIQLGISLSSLLCNHEGQVVLTQEAQTSDL